MAMDDRLMQPLLHKGMFAPLPVPASFAKGSTPNMSIRPGQIRAESQDGVAMIPSAFAMRHRYQELAIPVVIMAGAKDRVVSAKQPTRLHAQIPHSVLRLVPDVGHMLHYAVPEVGSEDRGRGLAMLDQPRLTRRNMQTGFEPDSVGSRCLLVALC